MLLAISLTTRSVPPEAAMMWSQQNQNRRYQFLGDRTFEDLGMVANVPLREQAGVRGSSVSLLTDNDKRAYSHWVTQCVIWSLSEILRERQANR